MLLRIFWEEMKTEAKLIFNLSEVAFYSTWVCATLLHSCLTLYNRMDHGPPGSSVHGDSPGKNTRVGSHSLLQGNLPELGIEPRSPELKQILYHLRKPVNYSND